MSPDKAASSPKGASRGSSKTKAAARAAADSEGTDDKGLRRPSALSLHIGLNAVSAAGYGGWTGPLAACEFDANDMASVAKAKGMKPTVLLGKKATRANVIAALRSAAKSLRSGDLFFLSYSGHGGQVPDANGDEDDKRDETWCLYDAQLIDDELYFELSRFGAGVRVLVLSDSCHSGTVARAPLLLQAETTPTQRPKVMPEAVAMRTYREHQAFYDKIQRDVAAEAGRPVADPDQALSQLAVSGRLGAISNRFDASLLLISGCQDNQTSMDGDHNGAFTEQVLNVWNQGKFAGNYGQFHARIKSRLPPTQSPNLFALGDARAFLMQTPFSI